MNVILLKYYHFFYYELLNYGLYKNSVIVQVLIID